jgi:hypothetical protein
MYIFLPSLDSAGNSKTVCLQVNYELGYVVGTILSSSYVHQVSFNFRFIYDPILLSSLETLGTVNTITEEYQESLDETDPKDSTRIIVVKDELYTILQAIVAYTRQKIFTDTTLCTVKEFVRGFRDVFSKTVASTHNRQLIEYVQRYIWYWFEQRLSITTYNGPRTRLYFFKIKSDKNKNHESIKRS